MDAGYVLLDHTADAGLIAWGPRPDHAFAAAARGMFAIILGRDPEELPESDAGLPERVEVAAPDWPSLLVNWLAELLFLFEVDGLVPARIEFERCAPPDCLALVHGWRLESTGEFAEGVGIKAVTYHQIRVEVNQDRTDLRVIFDI